MSKTRTLAEAKSVLKTYGITLSKKDGEYRVNFRDGGTEGTAYYANDINDAVDTGYAMAKRRYLQNLPKVSRAKLNPPRRLYRPEAESMKARQSVKKRKILSGKRKITRAKRNPLGPDHNKRDYGYSRFSGHYIIGKEKNGTTWYWNGTSFSRIGGRFDAYKFNSHAKAYHEAKRILKYLPPRINTLEIRK